MYDIALSCNATIPWQTLLSCRRPAVQLLQMAMMSYASRDKHMFWFNELPAHGGGRQGKKKSLIPIFGQALFGQK